MKPAFWAQEAGHIVSAVLFEIADLKTIKEAEPFVNIHLNIKQQGKSKTAFF